MQRWQGVLDHERFRFIVFPFIDKQMDSTFFSFSELQRRSLSSISFVISLLF